MVTLINCLYRCVGIEADDHYLQGETVIRPCQLEVSVFKCMRGCCPPDEDHWLFIYNNCTIVHFPVVIITSLFTGVTSGCVYTKQLLTAKLMVTFTSLRAHEELRRLSVRSSEPQRDGGKDKHIDTRKKTWLCVCLITHLKSIETTHFTSTTKNAPCVAILADWLFWRYFFTVRF